MILSASLKHNCTKELLEFKKWCEDISKQCNVTWKDGQCISCKKIKEIKFSLYNKLKERYLLMGCE